MARRFVAVALAIDVALHGRRAALAAEGRAPAYGAMRAVLLGKERHDVEVEIVASDALIVRFSTGGDEVRVESVPRPGARIWTGRVDGRTMVVAARPVLSGHVLSHGGFESEARVFTRRQADLAALMREVDDDDEVKALLCPMPGLVKKIHVEEGQEVKSGEPLCLIEAMKMENVLRAERDVTIKSIEASEGASLAVDAPIMTFA